jgi:hypothetical protein
MDGKDRVTSDAPQGLGRRESGFRADKLARALEEQERGVPLVEVPDRRLDVQRAESAHAADAQDELLAQAHLATANVEDVGDRPVRLVIDRHVGVEQHDRHATDLRHPDRGVDVSLCNRDLDDERRTVSAASATQWQL